MGVAQKQADRPRLLLDVNVWIALLDDAHIHNATAHQLIAQAGLKIASCAMVENGVLRVLNLPGYSKYAAPGFIAVRDKLREIYAQIDCEHWDLGLSLIRSESINWTRVMGHNQITDAYLLALAIAQNGALATLDHRIALSAVHGAQQRHLVLL